MSLPDAASLEGFSVAELRDVVGALVAEVGALRSGAEAYQATISALRAENQALRDEVARLKGLPPRPPSRPPARIAIKCRGPSRLDRCAPASKPEPLPPAPCFRRVGLTSK